MNLSRRLKFVAIAVTIGIAFCCFRYWRHAASSSSTADVEEAGVDSKPEVSASRFQDAQKQPDTELLGLRGEVAVLRAKLHEQTNKTDVTSA
ncbi:MAG TPA: hypothetical protein VM680_09310, partial [Verrucomicrobiae bacterium]|nr:hypothetical protein [Verrucomicrobiae bacterium]